MLVFDLVSQADSFENLNSMMLLIRNMESERCKILVRNELEKLGLRYKKVEIGEVEVKEDISLEKLKLFDRALRINGLELIENKANLLIDKIKEAIAQLVYHSDDLPKPNYSDFISQKVKHDYSYLSNLFSNKLGVTIEKYIILQKIARVKEILMYDKLSLSDIAFTLHYSSVAHLSNQFKKVTGLTPSFYRHLRNSRGNKT